MRLLPRTADWADLWTPQRRTGVVVLVCLIGAGAFAVASVAPLARALFNSGDVASAGAGAGTDRFATDLQLASDRVQGRSMFFVPSPPPPPPPPPRADPGPPPPPSRYAGPSLIAMINDEVWFSDGRKLAVGDEHASSDLAVLELRAPWSARLRWKGVEFDVPLFDRSALTHPSDLKDEPKDKDAKSPTTNPAPKPDADKPAAEPAPTTPPPSDGAKPPGEPTPPPPPADSPAPSPQPAPIPVPGSPTSASRSN